MGASRPRRQSPRTPNCLATLRASVLCLSPSPITFGSGSGEAEGLSPRCLSTAGGHHLRSRGVRARLREIHDPYGVATNAGVGPRSHRMSGAPARSCHDQTRDSSAGRMLGCSGSLDDTPAVRAALRVTACPEWASHDATRDYRLVVCTPLVSTPPRYRPHSPSWGMVGPHRVLGLSCGNVETGARAYPR